LIEQGKVEIERVEPLVEDGKEVTQNKTFALPCCKRGFTVCN
jgi:hypothetical protein